MPTALREVTWSYTLHPISKYVSLHRLSLLFKAFATNLVWKFANLNTGCSKCSEFREVMEAILALEKNGIWKIVDLKHKTLVYYNWVFSVKYKVGGSIERYEARLTAKGFKQTWYWLPGNICNSCKNEYNQSINISCDQNGVAITPARCKKMHSWVVNFKESKFIYHPDLREVM